MVLIDKRSSQLEADRNRLQTLIEETNTDEFEEKEGGEEEEGEDVEEEEAVEAMDDFEFQAVED